MIAVQIQKLNVKRFVETAFLLSPLLLIVAVTFNFSDTKWAISRLIPIVGVYCLIFYRSAMKENWQSPQLRPLLIISIAMFVLSTFSHLVRGDEFSLARTLLASVAYILLVPWRRISPRWIQYSLAIAAIICGLNALYEFFYMGIARVGIAINPIPYALYCAILALVCVNVVVKQPGALLRTLAVIGGILATIALILTDVRGVILFYPLVVFYLLIRLFPLSPKKYFIYGLLLLFSFAGFYVGFKNKIDERLASTVSEFQHTASGNYENSIGVRLTLWEHGVKFSGGHLLFGLGDERLEQSIRAISIKGAANQPHLHNQFIDTYARYGLIGVLLLMLWLASVMISRNQLGNSRVDFSPIKSSIVLMIVMASLTDVPFHHTHLVYLYTILLAVMLLVDGEESFIVKDDDSGCIKP